MIRTLKTAFLAVLLGLLMAPGVQAIDLNTEYLIGRWVLDAQDCKSQNAETIEFRQNGTFEGLRLGEVESVGFWRIDQELVVLHIVTSPAYFSDIDPRLAAYKDLYNYFQARMILFNIEKDSFDAFGLMGSELKQTQAVKCR